MMFWVKLIKKKRIKTEFFYFSKCTLVTMLDLVLSTALDPIGDMYKPCSSRSAIYPP